MTTTNLFNRKRAQVKNLRPGYRNRAWLAPVADFTTIEEPASSPGGTGKTIVADHAFATGKGFYEVYCAPKSVEADGESTGDTGAGFINYKPKFFLPGDDADIQALVEEGLLNEDLILIVEDANCPDGGMRQFGCECNPLNIEKVTMTSGNSADGKKGWLLEGISSCRFIYEGTIAAHP